MVINATYYYLKLLIPRALQITLRRMLVLRKRSLCGDIWPIDEKAGAFPLGWPGWPEMKRFVLLLTHDVETAKGQEKCYRLIELERRLGFRSSFNFVSEDYAVKASLRRYLVEHGFEVGVHGLTHFGNLFRSRKIFEKQVQRINQYLEDWESVGFRSPSMYHNLDWIPDLNIEYDSSTFDTDPFEPQPDGMGTIFPFWVPGKGQGRGYVELPYTLTQDCTLFILMKERNINIWKQKLDWIVEKGGMALLITHPDYMNFSDGSPGHEEYPVEYYETFLNYVKSTYEDQYWNVLPKELARYWAANFARAQEIVTPDNGVAK